MSKATNGAKRPHVLLFNVEQWRGDALGHMGNPAVLTPNIDRFVREEAVSFSRAFCQNPVCTPSRCSFMTGWYPHTRGHRTMYHMLRPDEPVLLRRMKNQGYFVWWGGKNDLVPAENGYDDYCSLRFKTTGLTYPGMHADESWRGAPGTDNYYSFYGGRIEAKDGGEFVDSDWAIIRGVNDFIRSYDREEPMCLFMAMGYVHPPYGVESPWYGKTDRTKLPPRRKNPDWESKPSILRGIRERQGLAGWDEARWSELRATYYDMCARVDHQFKLVLDTLRARGIYDDTLVIFFADHGDYTGDYDVVEKAQNCFEDCLTRVPLIVKPPKGTAMNPGVCPALTELIDVPATVEDFASLEPTHSHFGRSLRPLLAHHDAENRDAVFCEGGRRHGEKQAMELESTSAIAPGRLYWPRVGLQIQEGPEHTKAIMCRTTTHKYVRRLYEKDELYDLEKDPAELHNVSGRPEYREIEAALANRLLTHLFETSDIVPFDTNRRW